MINLENELLKVTINSKGAELTSIFDKRNNVEHIWYGKPDIWAGRAPNLFPVVGGCVNNEIHINGASYPMFRHGFARQSQFTKLEAKPDYAELSLHYSADTFQDYPYKFEFQVLFELTGSELTQTYKIINRDTQAVYFSVGAHPAFNVPFFAGENYEDYYLEFDKEEPLYTHSLSSNGYFNGETKEVATTGNKLHLTTHLFDDDALVFKNIQSRKVSLRSTEHNNSVEVTFPHFNYLGIWAKPGAPFCCIEPWLGCADTEGKIVDISQKENIQKVEKGHVFEADFSIKIN
ncbi:aldose 1-epimerase family protein [Pedobacter sp. HMF7647]|uniref:Aldose 1-epimerase family protein n=1 Tax=Hufsiella arboris TaxID=2695275 RepID=A0A7K1YCN6_9SPHI|nr:aldose 1-epimerase family protein [Hufsiella arboris]MXV52141.1 aldose 1-epimerase family protein [Hufsiella arboris]